jgi:serine/threonine-protein kinase
MLFHKGSRVSEFVIDAQIGAGGSGTVFRAHHALTGGNYALKFILKSNGQDPDAEKRVWNELRVVAGLKHPSIVGFHPPFEFEEYWVLVMDLVAGPTLMARLADRGRLSVAEVLDLGKRICEALRYVHSEGITHRDIKPANVMVRDDGTIVVLDFGIAIADWLPRLTKKDWIVGTPLYLAPEQVLQGTIDARADLHAVGCVLYEAATGRRPFKNMDEVVYREPLTPHLVNPVIPDQVSQLIMRLLAKDPAARYQTAADVIAAIDFLVLPPTRLMKAPRMRIPYVGALAAALVGLLGIAGYRLATGVPSGGPGISAAAPRRAGEIPAPPTRPALNPPENPPRTPKKNVRKKATRRRTQRGANARRRKPAAARAGQIAPAPQTAASPSTPALPRLP